MKVNEKKVFRLTFIAEGKYLAWTGGAQRPDTISYEFFVYEQKWEHTGIMRQYKSIRKDSYDNLIAGKSDDFDYKRTLPLKPLSETLVTYQMFDSFISKRQRQTINGMKLSEIKEMTETPEELGLHTPSYYVVEPKIELTVPDVIRDKPESIKQIKYRETVVELGFAIEEEPQLKPRDITFLGDVAVPMVTYCSVCGKVSTEGVKRADNKCPICSKHLLYYGRTIIDKAFHNHLKNEYAPHSGYNAYRMEQKTSNRALYVQATEKGIEIYRMQCELSSNNGVIKDTITVTHRMTHGIDGEKKCYKITKNGEEVCDAIHALGINTRNISSGVNAVYEDAFDFEEFVQKNENIMRKIGFMELLKYTNKDYAISPLFFFYMVIVNEYPIVEQIVKMGHANLFFSLYESLKKCGNLKNLIGEVDKLDELVNKNETKGNNAMRFPTYIGDYLIRKGANLKEYYLWRDIYELTSITKEQFDNIINSFAFSMINSKCDLSSIGNILKYGYTFEKLIAYIVKVYMSKDNQYNYGPMRSMTLKYIIETLQDYLMMCEMMGVNPDLYPQNLTKQHNDLDKIRREEEQKIEDEKKRKEQEALKKLEYEMSQRAAKMEEYLRAPKRDEKGRLPVGVPAKYDDYVVKIPRTRADFINEGNAQHNCVGGYYNRVLKGDCIVFFLRNKNTPDKSFITGDCNNGNLHQFYQSNNREVFDEDLLKIGRYISRKIKRGLDAGTIEGFSLMNK